MEPFPSVRLPWPITTEEIAIRENFEAPFPVPGMEPTNNFIWKGKFYVHYVRLAVMKGVAEMTPRHLS